MARPLYTDKDWVIDQGHELWTQEDHPLGALMRRCVDLLPDANRAAVEMRTWGRYTYQQIADEMGWPGRNYAHMYYKRGLRKLREILEREAGELYD